MKSFDQPTLNLILASLRLFQNTVRADIPIEILQIANGAEDSVDIDDLCKRIKLGSSKHAKAFMAGISLDILPAWCRQDIVLIKGYIRGVEMAKGAWEPCDDEYVFGSFPLSQTTEMYQKACSLLKTAQVVLSCLDKSISERLFLKSRGFSANGDLVLAVYDANGALYGSEFEIGPRPKLGVWSVFRRNAETGHAYLLQDVSDAEAALVLCADQYNAEICIIDCDSRLYLNL